MIKTVLLPVIGDEQALDSSGPFPEAETKPNKNNVKAETGLRHTGLDLNTKLLVHTSLLHEEHQT